MSGAKVYLKRLLFVLLLLLIAAPAWAEFPSEGTATATDTASGTSHEVNLPGSCASGSLFYVVGVLGGSVTAVAWGGSSVELLDHDDGSNLVTSGYLFSTGAESTVTITSTGSDAGAWLAWCVTGAHASQAPELTHNDDGNSQNPNPPQETASWGAEDNLWFACVSLNNDGDTITSYPADYTNGVDNANGTRVGCATRPRNIAAEDPGTFTLSDATGARTSWTVAIRPAAAVAGGTGGMLLRGVGN